MATIQDVAKLAGVSVATVSRVINKSSKVSMSTKEKVYSAIQELHYQPNLLGRNLRRSETKKILVLLPTLSNSFHSKVVRGMEDVANASGYSLMVCNTRRDINKERDYLELLFTKLVDGVIFTKSMLDTDELTAIGKKYPIIQCSEYVKGAQVSSVTIDNQQAAYDAVNYLVNIGHRNIAIITSNNGTLSAIQRLDGYLKAHHDAGLDIHEDYIKYSDYSFHSGIEATRQLFQLEKPPTAIFAISDILAVGTMKHLYRINKIPGKDVAVIGFDNTKLASMYTPTLTTVSQPRYEIGKITMELLLKRIKNSNTDVMEHIQLQHELILRESTSQNI